MELPPGPLFPAISYLLPEYDIYPIAISNLLSDTDTFGSLKKYTQNIVCI